jgi:hypothetical protein
LQTTLSQPGIVSSRVALLLRSAEIKPVLHGFVGGTPPPRCMGRLLRGIFDLLGRPELIRRPACVDSTKVQCAVGARGRDV